MTRKKIPLNHLQQKCGVWRIYYPATGSKCWRWGCLTCLKLLAARLICAVTLGLGFLSRTRLGFSRHKMERWYPSIQVYNIIIFQINLNYSVQHSTQVYIISIQIAINNLKVSLSPNNSGFSFLNRKRHLLEKHPFLKFHPAKPVKKPHTSNQWQPTQELLKETSSWLRFRAWSL